MQQMRAAGGTGRGPGRGGRAGVPRGLRGGQRTLRPADPRGRSRWECPAGGGCPEEPWGSRGGAEAFRGGGCECMHGFGWGEDGGFPRSGIIFCPCARVRCCFRDEF